MTKKGNYEDHFIDAVKEFDVVRSAFPQTGFVFDIATKEEFATFEAFRAAVSKNLLIVDWDKLSVTYTNLKGNTLTSTWNPTDYDVSKGTRVMVRPSFTVNGTEVAIDNDFIKGRAVMKSPTVELVNRVLRIQTPTEKLVVDWRREMPVFRNLK